MTAFQHDVITRQSDPIYPSFAQGFVLLGADNLAQPHQPMRRRYLSAKSTYQSMLSGSASASRLTTFSSA